jgi:pimeloyl-ACP methyl ester carboxylesterase
VTTAQKQTYADAPTQVVGAADGFDYAYRDVGTGTVPIVLLQHFRGNLDNWDPALVEASAPKGAAGMHGWARWVIDAVGKPELDPAGYLKVFFAESASSQQAGQQALQRMFTKTSGFDQPTSWQTRQAQYDAVCTWGMPNHALLQRLSAIAHRVFIANGESDPMILPHFSHLLAGLIPGAEIKIYPDSAHGFLFQHHAEFAADVEQFLRSGGGPDE